MFRPVAMRIATMLRYNGVAIGFSSPVLVAPEWIQFHIVCDILKEILVM